jgi:sugar/nucleoside kinase (ribokinase family)
VAEVWTMGEMLVEIMRPRAGMALDSAGEFLGPYPSGAPAIFADTVARLGHPAGIVGGVGRDDFGRCLLARLQRDGVDTRWVLESPRGSTAAAFVTYFDDGSRRFIFHLDGTPAVEALVPRAWAAGGPPAGARWFHVMGCSLMASEELRREICRAAEICHSGGVRISFDPNIRAELLGGRDAAEVVAPVLERAAILFPGEAELRLLAGGGSLDRAVEALFEREVLELIVLKRGKAGATVYSRAGAIDTPAFAVREVDPTGAGDCFDAGFLCGLLEGRPPAECGLVAAAAGALNAAAFGPMEGEISAERVRRMLESGG